MPSAERLRQKWMLDCLHVNKEEAKSVDASAVSRKAKKPEKKAKKEGLTSRILKKLFS